LSRVSKKSGNGSRNSPPEGKLRIELSESGIVTLCVNENPAAWVQARLIILERTKNARIAGRECIEVPWWEFAGVLPRLKTLTQVFPGLTVQVDQRTHDLITRSNQAADRLASASSNSAIPKDELKKVLSDLHFGPSRKLKTYQISNVCRLAALPNGATFSVPGAGKTTEALATFAFKTRLQSNLLVVCPKNAFAAWDEQVAACLPQFTVTRLTGGRTRVAALLKNYPKIAVITYSQLVNVVDIVQRHLAENPTVVFLDESHKIKGGEQKPWAASALSISHLPQWKLIMSGTPMPNSTDDLIPQIRFLYPNLGSVSDPVSTIQTFFVRTTKSQLDLPPVKSKGIPVPMTDAQAHIYRLCAAEVVRDAETALRSADKIVLRNFGRSYLLLLQLVSNPALLASHQGRFQDADLIACLESDSPKIAYVCYRARQLALKGKKVLIWSSFVQNVEVISARLADLGADFIHGEVEAGSEEEEETRENKIAKFHRDANAMVLVANPAACSEGISLHTVCHHAIYLDRNYNAAQFLQSADRIHRLGLKPGQDTYIEFVYCPGTIDESVNRRLDFKIGQMESALNDKSIALPTHWLSDLDELPDVNDIRDLLQTLRGNEV
jgi:SNF2 family DNA or RNA helicase